MRRQPVSVSKVFRFDTNTTVYSRVEALTDPRGMVGFAFQAAKDAFYGQYALLTDLPAAVSERWPPGVARPNEG